MWPSTSSPRLTRGQSPSNGRRVKVGIFLFRILDCGFRIDEAESMAHGAKSKVHGYGAESIGHGAKSKAHGVWGREQRAWGKEQSAWGMGQRAWGRGGDWGAPVRGVSKCGLTPIRPAGWREDRADLLVSHQKLYTPPRNFSHQNSLLTMVTMRDENERD